MKKTLFFKILFISLFTSIATLNAQNGTKIPKNVQELLQKKRIYNKAVGFGYRIQVYNGTEESAKSKQAKFRLLYPRVPSRLVYNAPDWKVHVGNYKSKLDADRAKLIFKKEFSGLIVVPMGK
ncbi:MAG: SPOR domain-containing protein [Polaribacter sp.]